MKTLSIFLNTVAISTVAMLSVSCSDDEPTPVDTTIEVSAPALHFTSKAESSQTVEVTSAVDWDVVVELDWLTAEKQGKNIVVTAQPSRSLTDRAGVITVVDNADPANTAVIEVDQDHGTPKKYDFLLGGIPIERFSPNGRYAAGEFDITGVVFDLYQIADDNYSPATYSKNTHPELASEGSFVMRGVADDGRPFARGVTADGSTTVKFERNTETKRYAPYVVKNGVSTDLEHPASYVTGSLYLGVYVDLISADGKYILGRINADGSTWIACKWTLEGTNYVFSEIASDSIKYDSNNVKFPKWPEPANVCGLSVMGEYSCGVLRVPQGGTIFNPIPAKYTPYMYKMSDGSLTVLDGEENSRASFVTDDGTLFCSTPYLAAFGADRTPYVFKNGTKSTFSEWVNSTYGLTVDNKGSVTAVAKDYSVVVWFTSETIGYVNHFIVVEP